jgi:hypothetical protein
MYDTRIPLLIFELDPVYMARKAKREKIKAILKASAERKAQKAIDQAKNKQ